MILKLSDFGSRNEGEKLSSYQIHGQHALWSIGCSSTHRLGDLEEGDMTVVKQIVELSRTKTVGGIII